MKKGLAIAGYLLLVALFFRFDLRKLLDARQLLLVISGAGILYLPSLPRKKDAPHGEDRTEIDFSLIGQNALWAGILQTSVLIFMILSGRQGLEEALFEVARACRSLLYGFCLWIILQPEESTAAPAHSQEPQPPAELTAEQCRSILAQKGLTNRETEIALLVIKGMTNAEIAEALFISEATVKKHLSNIFAKLDIKKRGQIREAVSGKEGG